ncbi:hypothetical protein BHM03_00039229, partial [Ensete ventricosum]
MVLWRRGGGGTGEGGRGGAMTSISPQARSRRAPKRKKFGLGPRARRRWPDREAFLVGERSGRLWGEVEESQRMISEGTADVQNLRPTDGRWNPSTAADRRPEERLLPRDQ